MYIHPSKLNVIETFSGFLTPNKVAQDDVIKKNIDEPIDFISELVGDKTSDEMLQVRVVACASVTSHQLRKKFFFKDSVSEDASIIGTSLTTTDVNEIAQLLSERFGVTITHNWAQSALDNCDVYIAKDQPGGVGVTIFLTFVLRSTEVDVTDESKWIDSFGVFHQATDTHDPVLKAVQAGII